ncbi:MAG: hypothetical protein KGJ59_12415 [Bacteroidota bacterium]|nr:hypothetical protein [Bacteroidota bacterium]
MDRVIILSGEQERLLQTLRDRLDITDPAVLNEEEKSLVEAKHMLRTVRQPVSRSVGFACKSLALQRYQFVIKSYLLVSGAKEKFLFDETGNLINVSFRHYLVVDAPRFIIEILSSFFVVGISYIRLFFRQRKITRTAPKGFSI